MNWRVLKQNNFLFMALPFLLALIPVCSVLFNEKVIPPLIICVLVFFLIEKEKLKNFSRNKFLLKPYVLYISVYILYLLLSTDIALASKQLEKQISLALIPCIVFSCNWNRERIDVFIKSYIVAMLGVLIMSVVILLWFVQSNSDWIEYVGSGGTNSISSYVQYKFPHLIGIHPSYLSYLLVMANIFLLGNEYFKIFKNKNFLTGLLIVFNLMLLVLFARTAFMVNILVHLLAFLVYLKNNRVSFWKFLVFVIFVIGLVTIAFQFPFIQSKFSNIFVDERFFLWPKSFEVLKNNYFIFGEGVGQGNVILKSFLLNTEDPRIYYNGFDVHNQYLKNYLDMGVLGFVSLIFLLIWPMLQKKKKAWGFESFPLYGFSLLFILSLMTESVLSVIKGIVFFAILSSVILIRNQISLRDKSKYP